MTAQELMRQALQLLGFTDTFGEPDSATHAEVYKRALAVINQVVCELGAALGGEIAPITRLQQALPLPETVARTVAPYGVAMYLAAAQHDGDNQQLFAALYDRKRTAMQRDFERRIDRLPRGWDA